MLFLFDIESVSLLTNMIYPLLLLQLNISVNKIVAITFVNKSAINAIKFVYV